MGRERWVEVEGFEGLYSVSDSGVVWSHRSNKVMKLRPDKNGYLLVDFRVRKSRSTFKVHRLVAKAFIPNPENLPEVDRRFGQVFDNRASKLRWTSVSANRKNKRRTSSASGVVGVCFRPKKKNPWQAYVSPNRRFKSLGHFSTKARAVKARREYESHNHV